MQLMLLGLIAQTHAEEIDFNRDVRPILSDKCYYCHGPDEENRKADLRLDIREEAIDMIEAGEIISRIHDDDSDVRMPPPESNLSLTAEEKKTLELWIESGAVYDRHWAFEALPATMPIPATNGDTWCEQPIDHFVMARLEKAQLVPNKVSEPLRWLRRATLDLTGLPPTCEEIASFEALLSRRDSQFAYENVVDRLLSSPAYGEHMAVAWLDAARYADSYGYQSDKLNTQWPYRDWVVRAFNDNMSYRDFLVWQLAGDLLENPTRDQKLATAFNRIHRLNNEGGAVFEEWRIENVADRVHTFGTAVLGLTLECCRCHDHKYDPIPTRDYYSLSAYFNSIDESGVYDRTEKVPCPSLLLPTEQQHAELETAKLRVNTLQADYESQVLDAKKRYESEHSGQTLDLAEGQDLVVALAFDSPFSNDLKGVYHPSERDRAWSDPPPMVPVKDCDILRLNPQLAADSLEGEAPRSAIQLDGERGYTVQGVEPFDRWMPFSVLVTMRETERSQQRSVIAHHTRGTDCGYNGWDLTIENGHLESRMARVWPGNAISVRTVDAIPSDQWHQIAATYDGSSAAKGLRLFLNGKELQTAVIRDDVKKQANVKVDHGGEFVIGQRFRDRGLAGGLIDSVRIYGRSLPASELKAIATGTHTALSANYWVSAVDESSRKAMQELTLARKAMVMAEEAMDEIPVMQETESPRPAHVLARGQYDAPQNESTRVQRGTFSDMLPPFPADQPRNRLGLANWVTDANHPLTARVAVNRLWSNFFGYGLVRSPENFGLQGELPTHPKLLDWLARDFVNHGWDVKRLCKQVVLSATYRQDSKVPLSLAEQDPDNRLLARGPAHRLSAEQIRDLALCASGLMDQARGGPPVSPYQPGKDLWRESNGMSPPYQQSVGQSLYRRSLYSVWKRTAPLPNMMALDATTREVCTVERSRTNTPLQALVLLNDTQFVEAAKQLALAITSDRQFDGKDRQKIREAFVRLAGRRPDERELGLLTQLLVGERKHFASHPNDAKQFVAIGQSVTETQDVTELAAMTAVCQAILNLDATVWKR